MLDQKTLHAALKKVSAAMMHLENTGFEEKYPIGLIDINLWEWPQGVGLYGLYNYYKLTETAGRSISCAAGMTRAWPRACPSATSTRPAPAHAAACTRTHTG
ncbi:MAG: hypothetical protein ACLR7U_06020 [Ruthenibacterium lactatiformans]